MAAQGAAAALASPIDRPQLLGRGRVLPPAPVWVAREAARVQGWQ